MADTSKTQPSIPTPPSPSARPEGSSPSSFGAAATKGPSVPPKVPAARGNEESGSLRKSESSPSNRSERENTAQKGAAPEASQRDQPHAGNTMLSMADAGIKKTRERVEDQIHVQRDRVTGGVRTLSRALRGAGGMLDEDELVARGLHYASDKAETVAGYVAELTPTRLATDLRDVSHKKPAWFFGGAFLLGLALGRFARSTAAYAGSTSRTHGLRS